MKQQFQETKSRKMSTYGKAQVIAASRRIHKSSVSDIWMIESERIKGKFYCVQYLKETQEIICDCPAYVYDMTVPCKHCLSVCISESEVEVEEVA